MGTNTETTKISTQIGIYRAKITPIDRLLKTTVGRQAALDDLIERLDRNAGKKGGQHYLFIGPRGIGKTHFLTLLENAVNEDDRLNKLYTVIRFPEENNRILSFADLLLGITEILGEAIDDEAWKALYRELFENEKDEEIIDTIIPRLRNYQKEKGKTLLILLENLDMLFTRQIKNEQDIHRFRSFLMDSPCAALVGTSPVYFAGLSNIKSPLYDFFDIQIIEDLSEEQTLKMIRKNLEWEQRTDILKDFDALIPKIKAMHTMTGGNPRLIIILYELIANDNLMEVKIQFQELLDRISPFYQERMKDLAPQERALLETMALMRTGPRTPANIAKQLRKPPQQTSSLLKRMTKAGYLTVSGNPGDKRSRLYRIKEGFFDLWLAMSESRVHNKRLGYLVEFFEMYYRDREEREKKRKELWQRLEGGVKGAEEFLKEVESISHKRPSFVWMTEQLHGWAEDGLDFDVSKWLYGMIEYWRTQRSGDLEKAVTIAHNLGEDLSGHGLHSVRIDLLKDALDLTKDPKEKYRLNIEIAQSQKMNGLLPSALISLQNALAITRESGDKRGEGTVLSNIGSLSYARGDYETALKYLEDSLIIRRETGDKRGEGTTLNNISQIYHARGDYETALEYLEGSLIIRREIGDKRGQIATLHNMAMIEQRRDNFDKMAALEMEAYKLALETGDAMGLFQVGRVLGEMLINGGQQEEGIEMLQRSYEIGQSAGLPETEKIKKKLLQLGKKTE